MAWYDEDVEFQNFIRLIILRAQKPVGVTAAGFYHISLQSYYNVKQLKDFEFFNFPLIHFPGIESSLFVLYVDEFGYIWMNDIENNIRNIKYSKLY